MRTHVISVDLVPSDAIAAMKLREAIDTLRANNAPLGVSVGPVNEVVLHGVSELHLELAVHHLRRAGLDFQVGAPQVHYRECITKTIEWDCTHKKQTGGTGEYAKVKIRFEPGEPGSGFVFESGVTGDAVPQHFILAVEKGLNAEKERGPVLGFPVTDLKCTLMDGGYHDVDSTERTFEIAARACFREAIPKAGARALEPMMYVIVLTPPEYLGDVIGDLNSRRGEVRGMETRGEMHEITTFVPFANLFGYQGGLLSMTRGSGQWMMTFSHYEQIPPSGRGPDDDTFPPAIGMRA